MYDIVDGQQRTITLALLLKNLTSENIPLLSLKISDNRYSRKNLYLNSKVLERQVDYLSEVEKDEFKGYIENNCEMIVVITTDLSEAFQFFDSQNARGKKLYPHDLLKAYHLREMNGVSVTEIEHTVDVWEQINQKQLSVMFNDYLYRLKEWLKGDRSFELTEQNIDLFKGGSVNDNYPYAQFYKSAYSYAESVNKSLMPFVTGIQNVSTFQLNAPIIAGKPFFDYAKHYFDILADIQNNDKYEGYFINDNEVVKTLNLRKFKNGVGNRITRLMLDTAILLYVDRFCPSKPSITDLSLLDRFFVYVFVWAYSMRAQYTNVGWLVAQNYIMGTPGKEVDNSLNIYKMICESDSPDVLLNSLSHHIKPLRDSRIRANKDRVDFHEKGVYQNYLYYFKKYKFWEGKQ